MGISSLSKYIGFINFILFCSGVGRQQERPVAPPVRSRGKRPSSSDSQGEPSQKARRDRSPNWSLNEMLALVDAKRDEFIEELDCIDGRDLMESEVTKWSRISDKVMGSGFSIHYRDGMACKGKWHLLLPDYRRVVDYHTRTGINDEDYWVLTPNELAAEKLPKSFSKEIYVRIHEWFGRRPQIQPPHVRDLLSPHDEVFPRGDFDSVDDGNEVVDLSVNEPSIDVFDGISNIDLVKKVVDGRDPPINCDPLEGSPIRLVPPRSLSRQGPNPLGGVGVPNGTHSHGLTPRRGSTVLLSDSSHSFTKRKIATTAIRRKSSAGVSALVEVAKSSSESIVTQIAEMASVTKETESNKLEVQLRLFSEQMAYQRERDMRIYEQSLLAADNARLAILKQGEIALALGNISNVLSLGLKGHIDRPRKASTPDPNNEAP